MAEVYAIEFMERDSVVLPNVVPKTIVIENPERYIVNGALSEILAQARDLYDRSARGSQRFKKSRDRKYRWRWTGLSANSNNGSSPYVNAQKFMPSLRHGGQWRLKDCPPSSTFA